MLDVAMTFDSVFTSVDFMLLDEILHEFTYSLPLSHVFLIYLYMALKHAIVLLELLQSCQLHSDIAIIKAKWR